MVIFCITFWFAGKYARDALKNVIKMDLSTHKLSDNIIIISHKTKLLQSIPSIFNKNSTVTKNAGKETAHFE